MVSRRDFLTGAATAMAAGAVSRAGAASLPEAASITHARTLPPPLPKEGRPFYPVVTLNGWSAPKTVGKNFISLLKSSSVKSPPA